MAQIVHTVCLQSKDADRVDESTSTFSWRLPGDCQRYRAARLQLGSIEMDMPQWNVETLWQNVYFMERFRFPRDDRTVELRVSAEDEDAESGEAAVHLHATTPAVVNPIVRWRKVPEGWHATTREPHGLRACDGASLLSAIAWDRVRVVASTAGSFELDETNCTFPEDDEIVVHDRRGAGGPDGALRAGTDATKCGALHVPAPRDPLDACAFLNAALASSASRGLAVRLAYQERHNLVVCDLHSTRGTALVVDCVRGASLLRVLGVCELAASPVRVGGARPSRTRVASQPLTCAWGRAALAPGVYVPAHRPVTTGQPRRLPQEFHHAFHALTFDPPDRIASGQMTTHYLCFREPSGRSMSVPVPCGRYTPDALCRALSTEMTAASQPHSPGVAFDVSYDRHESAYTFRCADGHGRPKVFALLLAQDAQFDPRCMGFPASNLHHSAEYTSAFAAPFPDCAGGEFVASPRAPQRAPSQRYTVDPDGETQTLRIDGAEARDLVGVVAAYDAARNALLVRTHVGILPYAHGHLPGDVVRLCPAEEEDGGVDVLAPDSDGEWTQRQVGRCPLRDATYAVVLDPPTGDATGGGGGGLSLCDVWLRTRATPDLARCVGTALLIRQDADATNLCCGTGGTPRSVWPRILGLRSGATLQSTAGAVRGAGGRRCGPILTDHFNMDIPDYMLIYLEGTKRGTLLHHLDGENATTPFAKLVLTPLYRDERMLPKDTAVSSAECLTHVDLRFANPDGTPYQWHKAPFALSLNLVRAEG